MKNVKLLGAVLLGLACVALVACDDKKSNESELAGLPAEETPSAPAPIEVKPGEVIVEPVSKIASAPGFDPNDASTIPAMPKAARAKPADVKKQVAAHAAAEAASSAASAPAQ